jgi:putative intracellular protease/amidase
MALTIYLVQLSGSHNISLSMIGKEKGPVRAPSPPRKNPPKQINENLPPVTYPVQGPEIVATHTFTDAPKLDILLAPGGMGLRVLDDDKDTSIPDFIASRFNELQYLLSVCTGAASLAQSGVLKGRRATTNKASWAWATHFGEGVNWVPTARWVEDGKVWSSSGVSAGKELTLASF